MASTAARDAISQAADRWNATTDVVLSRSPRATVQRGGLDGDRPIVLKYVESPAGYAAEIAGLKHLAESGVAVRLLAQADDLRVMQLEYIPGAQADDDDLARALVRLLAFEAAGPPDHFAPLVERISDAFLLSQQRLDLDHNALGRHLSKALQQGQSQAEMLARDRGRFGMVHGDLQHKNVLRRPTLDDHQVVVIDPMPHAGDRTFDAIDYIANRATSKIDIVQRVEHLSTAAPELDADRALAWVRACSPVLAASRLGERATDQAGLYQLELHFCGIS
ncbi:aminoglycoside phosphotransferase family protein [Pimelobacter simplex]|uniref:aminoglycoside phosphotransferase family protein n=1 Tax=Nocardioides simplex TaxID=2045 RepID=UPI003AABA13F